jgi:hypothetical protein
MINKKRPSAYGTSVEKPVVPPTLGSRHNKNPPVMKGGENGWPASLLQGRLASIDPFCPGNGGGSGNSY